MIKEAYPDPTDQDRRNFVCVDIKQWSPAADPGDNSHDRGRTETR